MADLDRAIEFAPESLAALFNRAVLRYQNQNYKQALGDFNAFPPIIGTRGQMGRL